VPGKKIETEMAEEVGIKVFRTYSNYGDFEDNRVEKLSQRIKEWYDKDEEAIMNLIEFVYIGKDNNPSPVPSP